MPDFVDYLESLTKDDQHRDNAALAALRRGLSQAPGSTAEMYPYLIPHLSDAQQRYHFDTYCLLASLYAFHPAPGGKGNFGAHMRQAGKDDSPVGVNEATERRFVNLLRVRGEDLPFHLRQAVSFLKSKDTPVNWRQLLTDLLHWDDDTAWVQKEWARGFWSSRKEETPSDQSNGNTEF